MLAALAGMLALALILELSLRLAGCSVGTPPTVQRRVDASVRDAPLRVLCVGDSFTYGLGAPTELSYPQQLQDRLDETLGLGQAAVVNLGLPSATAPEQRSLLPAVLEAARPQAVIVLLGGTSLRDPRAARAAATGEHAEFERGPELRLLRLLRFLGEDVRAQRLSAQADPGSEDIHTRTEGRLSPGILPHAAEGPMHCPGELGARYAAIHEALMGRDPSAALRAVEGALGQPEAERCSLLPLSEAVAHDQLGDSASTRDAILRGIERFPCDRPLQRAQIDLLSSQGQHCEVAERIQAWHERCQRSEPLPTTNIAESLWRCGDSEASRRWYEGCAEQETRPCNCRWGVVRAALEEVEDAEARAILETFAQDVEPGCTQDPGVVPRLCRAGLAEDAIRWAEANIARDPPDWLQQLGAVLPCADPPHLARLEEAALAAGLDRHAVTLAMQTMADRSRMLELARAWTLEELAMIADGIEAHGAVPILATYPYPSEINPGIRQLASDRQLPLLDHERSFQALLDRGEPRWDYFTRDGDDPLIHNDHCNGRGYGVMAENAAALLSSLALD